MFWRKMAFALVLSEAAQSSFVKRVQGDYRSVSGFVLALFSRFSLEAFLVYP